MKYRVEEHVFPKLEITIENADDIDKLLQLYTILNVVAINSFHDSTKLRECIRNIVGELDDKKKERLKRLHDSFIRILWPKDAMQDQFWIVPKEVKK